MKTNPTAEQLLAYVNALGAHVEYNFETGDCDGVDDWCTQDYLKAAMPMGGASAVLLWPAYAGVRLWMAIWIAIPALFGYRYRVVVVNGKAGATFVKRGKGHEPKAYTEVAPSHARKAHVKQPKA